MQRTIALVAGACLVAVVLGTTLAAGASAQMASDQLEALLVNGADTPAEHQALAAYYRDKAAESRKKAEHHKAMATHYKAAAYKGRDVPKHCEKLVSLNEQAAVEYDALAEAQDAAAKM